MPKKCPVCDAEMKRKFTYIRTQRGDACKVYYWKCPDCGHTTGAEVTFPRT